jgi:hypothetical protein
MLSLEDYKSLEETAHLLRTPANAKRLLSAATQLNAGKGVLRSVNVVPATGMAGASIRTRWSDRCRRKGSPTCAPISLAAKGDIQHREVHWLSQMETLPF